jgi:hypothetical protein
MSNAGANSGRIQVNEARLGTHVSDRRTRVSTRMPCRFVSASFAQMGEGPFQGPLWMGWVLTLVCFACAALNAQPQDLPLAHLKLGPDDPLYTTYAAPLARSEYFYDQAYFLQYADPAAGIEYQNQTAGSFGLGWRLGGQNASATHNFAKPAIVHRSYTDLVELEYWPFKAIEVRETFDVYSSRMAIIDVQVSNHDTEAQTLTSYVLYHRDAPVADAQIQQHSVVFSHTVDPKKTLSEVEHHEFDPEFTDLLMSSVPPEHWTGAASFPQLLDKLRASGPLDDQLTSTPSALALQWSFTIPAGATAQFRVIRGAQPSMESVAEFLPSAQHLLQLPLAPVIAASEQQYSHVPRACAQPQQTHCVRFADRDWELAYWSALTQVRQQMLPPEGDAHFNYYLFSREPTWSWGHDGQVFHESIVMQAYALMDPRSAEDSQRVFIERQVHDTDPKKDGYIGYRVGPYVNRTFPTNGELTSSAPFFSWTNWEIYRFSHDRKFLREAYRSGSALANWYLRTHDPDHDGVLVWGGNAMLENVRDSLDVIWNLFGGSDESPKRVKALDLMCMMVKETRSLAAMARELGLTAEQKTWNAKADALASVVRTRMWDEETGFFYNLARDTGTFATRDGISLKRKEIIGFLPLWAGIATRKQAERLRQHTSNPASFARRYGMPTLAADDPDYHAEITRCCQWNGAVWLPWNYMVESGLLDYGFRAEAEQLAQRAIEGVLLHLRADHRLWESYSPDLTEINSPKNYIWDGIVARMIFELYGRP